MKRIRVAFVKFGGLSAGGTEKWLQMMAAGLPRDEFEIDYYYCDAAPYVGVDYVHADTDPHREQFMRDHGVRLVKFRVGAKDVRTSTHDWLDTDFWKVFDQRRYDLVQTAKAGPAEYPYYLLDLPVVEFVTLAGGPDFSPNLAWSIHLSQWQRRQWGLLGGRLDRSSVIPIPAAGPTSDAGLRRERGIPDDALVAGFHQRNDDHLFSPIPLAAFATIAAENRYFLVMGGGKRYREQAQELGLGNARFVEHSGAAADVSRFLNTLDVFAHGRSDGETFGAVLAEAMAHGKPCVTHYVRDGANAQAETIGPGGVCVWDREAYARALDRCFAEPAYRALLGAKAKAHAEAHYSTERCLTDLAEIYRRTLDPARARRRSSTMSYGASPLGFLVAGDVDQPAAIAHHVLTREKPEGFDVGVTRFFLPRTKTFVDIGANTGLYCLAAAHECPPDAAIHAFEPQADCCEALLATRSLNNWENRLCVHQSGLAEAPGELTLHLSGSGSTFDNAFNDHQALPTAVVPVDTLDRQAAALGLGPIDFIKIGVEGFELRVLEGASGVIARDRPVLFVEIADRVLGRTYRNPNYARTIAWLETAGYVVLRSDGRRRLIPADARQEQAHLAMYLCVHRSRWAEVEVPLERWVRACRREQRREELTRWIVLLRAVVRLAVKAKLKLKRAVGRRRLGRRSAPAMAR